MPTSPRYPKRDDRPYWILLIPDDGPAYRPRRIWHSADHALASGISDAQSRYVDTLVEVVILYRPTITAVASALIRC